MYRSLAKKGPWAEHLTSLAKMGVGTPLTVFAFNQERVPTSCLHRAVGAGPAGPAATGPIFGQLTRAKMPPPMSFGGLFNCYSKSSYARRDPG